MQVATHLGLFGGDAMQDETSLDIVVDAEEFARLLDGDNIHESCGEGGIGAHLAVDLDQTLVDDLCHLRTGQGVLQLVTEDEDDRQGLAKLVWSSGRTGSLQWNRVVGFECRVCVRRLTRLTRARQTNRRHDSVAVISSFQIAESVTSAP